ncbi:MAG TPA: SDR family oxidoreductase [Actinobacteria bacterium]|nr:SDR family oxidoreductase [Actinomycetota bacterium]
MTGRTCMVTGASSGIGKATAIGLARMGADLVLVCRDRGRGEDAAEEISDQAGSGFVELLIADLGVQSQIRRLAEGLLSTSRPLHVLVNNAGVTINDRSETEDGIETTFAINHLGPFLLTNLLLDRIKESAPSRVVTVSSVAHKFGSGMNFEDINSEQNYGGLRVYGRSKLANILFTRELARRLEGTDVTANSLHPGSVASNFGQNNGGFLRPLIRLMAPMMKSPEKGAQTSIFLASSPEVQSVSGAYFVNCKEQTPGRAATDEADAKRLWDLSTEMTSL